MAAHCHFTTGNYFMSVHCPNGHENAAASAFCSTCGTPIAASGTASESAAPARLAADSPSAGTPTNTASPYGTGTPPPPSSAPTGTQPAWLTAGTGRSDASASSRGQSRNKRLTILIGAGAIVALAAIIATVILVGGGESGATANGKSLRGIAMLFDKDGNVEGSWNDCKGTGGYDDFNAGMRLSIKGKDDEIVGTGNVVNITEDNLDNVVRAEFDGDSPIGLDSKDPEKAKSELRDFLKSAEGTACVLYFEADIENSDYYSVELANRGDLSFSRDELKKQGYVISTSLGDL
jgi:hypothetical protein